MSPNPNQLPDPIGNRGESFASARLPWRRTAIMREILTVLGIKAVALCVIWWVWFSAPEARHMQLSPERVQYRVVETPVAQAYAVQPPSSAGNPGHAAH